MAAWGLVFIRFIYWRSSGLFRRDLWLGGADYDRSGDEGCFVAGLVSLSRLSRLKNCTGWDKNWIYPHGSTGICNRHYVSIDQPQGLCGQYHAVQQF